MHFIISLSPKVHSARVDNGRLERTRPDGAHEQQFTPRSCFNSSDVERAGVRASSSPTRRPLRSRRFGCSAAGNGARRVRHRLRVARAFERSGARGAPASARPPAHLHASRPRRPQWLSDAAHVHHSSNMHNSFRFSRHELRVVQIWNIVVELHELLFH